MPWFNVSRVKRAGFDADGAVPKKFSVFTSRDFAT